MGLSAFNRARALANEKAKAENESGKVEGVTVEPPKVEETVADETKKTDAEKLGKKK